jgi:hypothetical protein
MSPRQRLLSIELASIGAPVLLVYFGQTALSGNAPAHIAVQVSGPALPPAPTMPAKSMTPEQQKATEWARLMPKSFNLTSPLNHPTDAPVIKPTKVDEEPRPVARQSPVNGLKLSAVLGNDGDKLASISGKIYRIGDEVRPGLKLTSIDPRNSVISLTDDDGQVYEIKRDQK